MLRSLSKNMESDVICVSLYLKLLYVSLRLLIYFAQLALRSNVLACSLHSACWRLVSMTDCRNLVMGNWHFFSTANSMTARSQSFHCWNKSMTLLNCSEKMVGAVALMLHSNFMMLSVCKADKLKNKKQKTTNKRIRNTEKINYFINNGVVSCQSNVECKINFGLFDSTWKMRKKNSR